MDEVNRSWVGDSTNRTWLDDMTGGKYTGSRIKNSPFEEVGSGPGQWFVRRFDKETVPGWWETEPGPGEGGGMIPGAHDRVYHSLSERSRGDWKKEADGKGGFRWVYYAAWKKPKPDKISENAGVGMWATEKRADGAVRWVWCGPEGKTLFFFPRPQRLPYICVLIGVYLIFYYTGTAGAEGEKSVDEYGAPQVD